MDIQPKSKKDTNRDKLKTAWSNQWVKVGSGLAVGVIIGSLATGLIVSNQSSPTAELNTGAKATSSDIWHQIGDVPEGWTKQNLSTDTEPINIAKSTALADNDQIKCNYTVAQSMFEKPEFDNLSGDYLASKHVLDYGSSRGATNAKFDHVELDTSGGKALFAMSSYEMSYDIDGDGKSNNVKEARLAHAYPEQTDEDGRIPLTEISYTCFDAGNWSPNTLDSLLKSTTINITGDTPVIPEETDASVSNESVTKGEGDMEDSK